MYVRAGARLRALVRARACVRAREGGGGGARARVCARVRVCVRVCRCARVCACAGARAYVCTCVRVRVRVRVGAGGCGQAGNPPKKKYLLRVASLQRVPYHSCALPMARQFKFNFTAMKKHVYTLYLARVNDPHERTIQYNFDSAEAVLSELIALSNIHGYKYPAGMLLDIAKSVNMEITTVEVLARFYRNGGILGGEHASYIPCELTMRPLYDTSKRNPNTEVTLQSIVEVSQ